MLAPVKASSFGNANDVILFTYAMKSANNYSDTFH